MSMFGPTHSLPRLSRSNAGRETVLSVLDLGSSKVCCLVGRLVPREKGGAALPGRSHAIEIIGFGHHRSAGVKAGTIVDMDAAESAMRLAVDSAERSAGVTIDSVIVSTSAGRLGSRTFSSSITLDGSEVEPRDLRTVLHAGADHAVEDGRAVLHSLPIGYSLDGEHRVVEPVGLAGEELGVDMHVVTAQAAPLRNLEATINRLHLGVEAVAATPYASGLATLADDETRIGCA